MAERACASLTFTFFIDVPSLVCVDPNYLNWPTSSGVFNLINVWSWFDAVDENFAFVGADSDFHAVSTFCFLQSFGELSEFFFTVSQQLDVVSKPQVAKWSSSDGQ